MNRNILRPILTLVGIGVAFASIAQETISRTFSGIDEIEMSVASGDAIFKKSTGGEISVELIHTYNIDYNPTIEQRGSTLIIKEDRNNRNRSYSGSATWTIAMPDDTEVEFNTGSGDVSISDLVMEADMNSGSGDFEISGAEGDFRINTGSGDIEAEDMKGELKMNTGSGDIELDDILAEVSANTGSGDIEGSGIALDGGSSFNAGSGDVEIELAASLDYDISLNSGSGDAVLDFSGNKIEGEIVMEANKRNGRITAPFEFDTEEEIDNGYNTVIKKTKKIGSKDVRIRVSSGSGTAEIKE